MILMLGIDVPSRSKGRRASGQPGRRSSLMANPGAK
jgi:hypothetical protein